MKLHVFAVLVALSGCDTVAEKLGYEKKTESKKSAADDDEDDKKPAQKEVAHSAMKVCEQLVTAGHGSGCRKDSPGGVGATAEEKAVFDLKTPAGKTCQVLTFKTRDAFDTSRKAFDGAAKLVGPRIFVNSTARVIVQCNDGMPKADGQKLELDVYALKAP